MPNEAEGNKMFEVLNYQIPVVGFRLIHVILIVAMLLIYQMEAEEES